MYSVKACYVSFHSMPIYEYRCENCHKTFDVMQKITDEPLDQCIICKEGKVRKLMSVSSFRLKGNGWYRNDSKKETSQVGHK